MCPAGDALCLFHGTRKNDTYRLNETAATVWEVGAIGDIPFLYEPLGTDEGTNLRFRTSVWPPQGNGTLAIELRGAPSQPYGAFRIAFNATGHSLRYGYVDANIERSQVEARWNLAPSQVFDIAHAGFEDNAEDFAGGYDTGRWLSVVADFDYGNKTFSLTVDGERSGHVGMPPSVVNATSVQIARVRVKLQSPGAERARAAAIEELLQNETLAQELVAPPPQPPAAPPSPDTLTNVTDGEEIADEPDVAEVGAPPPTPPLPYAMTIDKDELEDLLPRMEVDEQVDVEACIDSMRLERIFVSIESAPTEMVVESTFETPTNTTAMYYERLERIERTAIIDPFFFALFQRMRDAGDPDIARGYYTTHEASLVSVDFPLECANPHVTYAWEITRVPTGSLVSASTVDGLTTTIATVKPDLPGEYALTLTAFAPCKETAASVVLEAVCNTTPKPDLAVRSETWMGMCLPRHLASSAASVDDDGDRIDHILRVIKRPPLSRTSADEWRDRWRRGSCEKGTLERNDAWCLYADRPGSYELELMLTDGCSSSTLVVPFEQRYLTETCVLNMAPNASMLYTAAALAALLVAALAIHVALPFRPSALLNVALDARTFVAVRDSLRLRVSAARRRARDLEEGIEQASENALDAELDDISSKGGFLQRARSFKKKADVAGLRVYAILKQGYLMLSTAVGWCMRKLAKPKFVEEYLRKLEERRVVAAIEKHSIDREHSVSKLLSPRWIEWLVISGVVHEPVVYIALSLNTCRNVRSMFNPSFAPIAFGVAHDANSTASTYFLTTMYVVVNWAAIVFNGIYPTYVRYRTDAVKSHEEAVNSWFFDANEKHKSMVFADEAEKTADWKERMNQKPRPSIAANPRIMQASSLAYRACRLIVPFSVAATADLLFVPMAAACVNHLSCVYQDLATPWVHWRHDPNVLCWGGVDSAAPGGGPVAATNDLAARDATIVLSFLVALCCSQAAFRHAYHPLVRVQPHLAIASVLVKLGLVFASVEMEAVYGRDLLDPDLPRRRVLALDAAIVAAVTVQIAVHLAMQPYRAFGYRFSHGRLAGLTLALLIASSVQGVHVMKGPYAPLTLQAVVITAGTCLPIIMALLYVLNHYRMQHFVIPPISMASCTIVTGLAQPRGEGGGGIGGAVLLEDGSVAGPNALIMQSTDARLRAIGYVAAYDVLPEQYKALRYFDRFGYSSKKGGDIDSLATWELRGLSRFRSFVRWIVNRENNEEASNSWRLMLELHMLYSILGILHYMPTLVSRSHVEQIQDHVGDALARALMRRVAAMKRGAHKWGDKAASVARLQRDRVMRAARSVMRLITFKHETMYGALGVIDALAANEPLLVQWMVADVHAAADDDDERFDRTVTVEELHEDANAEGGEADDAAGLPPASNAQESADADSDSDSDDEDYYNNTSRFGLLARGDISLACIRDEVRKFLQRTGLNDPGALLMSKIDNFTTTLRRDCFNTEEREQFGAILYNLVSAIGADTNTVVGMSARLAALRALKSLVTTGDEQSARAVAAALTSFRRGRGLLAIVKATVPSEYARMAGDDAGVQQSNRVARRRSDRRSSSSGRKGRTDNSGDVEISLGRGEEANSAGVVGGSDVNACVATASAVLQEILRHENLIVSLLSIAGPALSDELDSDNVSAELAATLLHLLEHCVTAMHRAIEALRIAKPGIDAARTMGLRRSSLAFVSAALGAGTLEHTSGNVRMRAAALATALAAKTATRDAVLEVNGAVERLFMISSRDLSAGCRAEATRALAHIGRGSLKGEIALQSASMSTSRGGEIKARNVVAFPKDEARAFVDHLKDAVEETIAANFIRSKARINRRNNLARDAAKAAAYSPSAEEGTSRRSTPRHAWDLGRRARVHAEMVHPSEATAAAKWRAVRGRSAPPRANARVEASSSADRSIKDAAAKRALVAKKASVPAGAAGGKNKASAKALVTTAPLATGAAPGWI